MRVPSSGPRRSKSLLCRPTFWLLPVFFVIVAAPAAVFGHELPISVRQLTFHPFADRHPAWSPDGKEIIFDSNRDGRFHLWSIKRDGSGLRQLTRGPWNNTHPSFSPDGRRIAFDSDRSGVYQMWLMERDGSNPRRITNSSNWQICYGWSPDGAYLAYAENNAGVLDLWLTPGNGGKPTLLSFGKKFGREMSWSPDSQSIAFDSFASGNFDIWVMRRDGSELRQITTGKHTEHFPRWNRRDGRIYYIPHGHGHGAHRMWSMRPDGSDKRPATDSFTFSGGLRISPDGSAIVFDATMLGDSNIYVMPLDVKLDAKGEANRTPRRRGEK